MDAQLPLSVRLGRGAGTIRGLHGKPFARAYSPTADDDRYLNFQSWQEGVARYTQLKMARLAAEKFTSSSAFAALADYQPFGVEASTLERAIGEELTQLKLGDAKRVLFYSTGAATALLLDRINPGWRAHYFETLFTLEPIVR